MFGGGFMFLWWILGIVLVVWIVKSLMGGNQHGGHRGCCGDMGDKKSEDHNDTTGHH